MNQSSKHELNFAYTKVLPERTKLSNVDYQKVVLRQLRDVFRPGAIPCNTNIIPSKSIK